MEPLSAASMESGSYERAYTYITRLHILTEVESSLRFLFDQPDSLAPVDPWLHGGGDERIFEPYKEFRAPGNLKVERYRRQKLDVVQVSGSH